MERCECGAIYSANICSTVGSQRQTFASRHKWATVYDIKNCELRTGVQSGVVTFELRFKNGFYFLLLITSMTLMKAPQIAPENDRKTPSRIYSLSCSMKPQNASRPSRTIEWMNQKLPSIFLAAFMLPFSQDRHGVVRPVPA